MNCIKHFPLVVTCANIFIYIKDNCVQICIAHICVEYVKHKFKWIRVAQVHPWIATNMFCN